MLTRSENNNAIVTTLENVREHPNADRLKLATVLGTQVIVGLDSKDGDVVIYFESNLRLSPVYLYHNNLYSNPEMNEHPTQKGYFGKNGRIKAQRFRGEISNGYVASLESLLMIPELHYSLSVNYDTIAKDFFNVGDEFTHINGVEICSKYIIPTKGGYTSAGRKSKAPISDMFWRHWDTKHLMREKDRIPTDQIIYVEEKIHGTSARTGNVLCRTNRPWWKFWAPKEEWRVLSGTRRVDRIGNHLPVERQEIEQKVSPHLHKGEQIYYEIFGYTKAGGEIQSGFPYGCKPGEYRVMLYRVTITTPDGFCVDLSREQVYKRAEELGLEKPVLITKFPMLFDEDDMNWRFITRNADGKSCLDANTLREGIVVWFQDNGSWNCLKHKSEEYLIFESKQKDEGVSDAEDML